MSGLDGLWCGSPWLLLLWLAVLAVFHHCTEKLIIIEPAIDKTYNNTCDQRRFRSDCAESSLIACAFYNLQAIQKRNKRKPLPYWVDVTDDLSLYWSHRSYWWYYRLLNCFVLCVNPVTTGNHYADRQFCAARTVSVIRQNRKIHWSRWEFYFAIIFFRPEFLCDGSPWNRCLIISILHRVMCK